MIKRVPVKICFSDDCKDNKCKYRIQHNLINQGKKVIDECEHKKG